MRDCFPQYQLTRAWGNFYLFRKREDEELYSYILFQREGKPYNQLVISECGIGYNKNWNGHPSNFIGSTNSLAYLMSNNRPTSNIGWIKYGDTADEMENCMQGLRRQIDTYVFPFFEKEQQDGCRASSDQRSREPEKLDITGLHLANIYVHLYRQKVQD